MIFYSCNRKKNDDDNDKDTNDNDSDKERKISYLRTILVIDCMLSRCVASWNFKLQAISSDEAEIHLQGINFWSWRFLGLGDLTEIATTKFHPQPCWGTTAKGT